MQAKKNLAILQKITKLLRIYFKKIVKNKKIIQPLNMTNYLAILKIKMVMNIKNHVKIIRISHLKNLKKQQKLPNLVINKSTYSNKRDSRIKSKQKKIKKVYILI